MPGGCVDQQDAPSIQQFAKVYRRIGLPDDVADDRVGGEAVNLRQDGIDHVHPQTFVQRRSKYPVHHCRIS